MHAPLSHVARLCRDEARSYGYEVLQEEETRFVIREPFRFGFSNPADISVLLQEKSNETYVTLVGSNFGWGPIQSGHVRRQVTELKNRLDAAFAATP